MSLLGANSRLLLAFCALAIAAVYFHYTRQIMVPRMGDPVGPRVFPHILQGGLVLTAAALVVEHVTLRARGMLPSGGGEGVGGITLATIGLFAGYLLAFNRLGFLLASALFLVTLLSLTNRGKWRTNVLVAIGVPLALYIVVGVLFGARLPRGVLAFL